MFLNVCLSYTSRDDIAHAVKNMVAKVENGELSPVQINQNLFENMLYTGDSPPLDILVRTSGATRLSDFMLWEGNEGCHVQFVDSLWPDFNVWDMYRILLKWSFNKSEELK
jgi:ditrans,polycis-polyprenyl diphosphate synthase